VDIINKLVARDLVLGTMAREARECSQEGRNMAALACLFILVEQAVKLALDKTEGNFARLLRVAKRKGLLSAEEFVLVDHMREVRNKLFHESHYAWFSEKNGVLYPFSEDETRKAIFDKFSDKCFEIILKLLH
jgi:hypothetical protein